MPNFGIICETNPIHNGHKLLIDTAKAKNCDAIVCVMSGNTVQRGEFAIADKYLRAEALLQCGADLVIELPFPWSCSSAEYFSKAGMSIISNFCDTLIFGSESGNIEMLSNVAEAVSSEKFTSEYNTRISTGERSAALYYEMIKEKANSELSSNDILGVEYIKAARKLNLTMNF